MLATGKLRLVVVLATILAAGIFFRGCPNREPALPDFSRYTDVAERKEAFFGYFLPLVQEANAEILNDRARLLRIREGLVLAEKRAEKKGRGAHVRGREARWLRRLANDYGFEEPSIRHGLGLHFVDEVLLRVDVIPPSLALAQAANESAWGTSRFAQQGNNFFGLRSTDGSGLVPKRRARGAAFRVATYASPRESVRAYIETLNTQLAYRRLWAIRAEDRRQGRKPSGLRLANGLHSYSERGEAYVRLIQSMIRTNGLAQYDAESSFVAVKALY